MHCTVHTVSERLLASLSALGSLSPMGDRPADTHKHMQSHTYTIHTYTHMQGPNPTIQAPSPTDDAAEVASILVQYDADIFEDSDEDENDFDDVVRHCTSECHALFHLRQVRSAGLH